jgi:hypothetical protein
MSDDGGSPLAIVSAGGVAAAQNEGLEFLTELAVDAVSKHQALVRQTTTGILDTCENAVRLGFYLSDAKSLLPPEVAFGKWVTARIGISEVWSCQLRRPASHFTSESFH